ncbi:MAG: hypothetical protein HY253_12255 [Burkholderiales bacterium]|nr:hypothetical protein [Burkholderiales bacterium]
MKRESPPLFDCALQSAIIALPYSAIIEPSDCRQSQICTFEANLRSQQISKLQTGSEYSTPFQQTARRFFQKIRSVAFVRLQQRKIANCKKNVLRQKEFLRFFHREIFPQTHKMCAQKKRRTKSGVFILCVKWMSVINQIWQPS